MKKSTLITIAALVSVAIALLVVVSMYISTSNRENMLRNQFNAVQKDLHNQLDLTNKKISQTAQVTQAQMEALKDIIVGNAQARAQQGKGSMAAMVTEAVPNVDTSTYKTLINLVAGARDTYAAAQTRLLDVKREHDNVRTLMPGSFFVGGRPELEVRIVTSSRTEEAFSTGKDDDTTVFPVKPATAPAVERK